MEQWWRLIRLSYCITWNQKQQREDCVYVVDGNAIIQSCIALPETFGELAQQIFRCLPRSAEVHFVTDCYHQQSIKSFERSQRQIQCHGSKTKVPRDFKSFLANSDNKIKLIHFLWNEWQSSKYAQQLLGRKVKRLQRRVHWHLQHWWTEYCLYAHPVPVLLTRRSRHSHFAALSTHKQKYITWHYHHRQVPRYWRGLS